MTSNLDKFFKTNSKYETEGVDYVLSESISLRIRRFSPTNPKAAEAAAKHLKPHAHKLSIGSLSNKEVDEINIKMFVDACLVDWVGIEIDGKPAECTKENAIKLFTDLPDFFESVWKFANSHSNYKEEVGNS